MAEALATARPRRVPLLNLVLFVATVATTLLAGASQVALPPGELTLPRFIAAGLPFAASLIAILLCHEMGHYLMARAYGVDSTLPFFIPVPFGGIGTFGAVIRIRSAMPSRRAVFDIGAAGPIAGFLVALPLLFWGFAHSEVRAVGEAAAGASNVGSPFALVEALLRHEPLHGGAGTIQLMGDSLITWLAARITVGPLPPGYDVFLSPVAFAAWLGLFVTTLNLVPIGQLDGGHVVYALLGRRGALIASRLVSLGLLLCGLFLSWNWLVWWLLTRFFVGLRHPPALVEEPLGLGRRVVAVLSLLLFAVTFIPVPISVLARARKRALVLERSASMKPPGDSAPPVAPETAEVVPDRSEEEAWAKLQASWDDPSAHRAYLDRFADLEGLGAAGRRYRAALEDRPWDAAAARGRDEVLRRAMARGLAMLPRTRPPRRLAFRGRRVAMALAAAAVASGVAWVLLHWPVATAGAAP